jgi:hypothetical protein
MLKGTGYCTLTNFIFHLSMETIAVTQDQAKALLAEAKKRAKRTKVEGGYKMYFKHVRGKVPSETDNKTSCAGHRLVRVVCGLRECAGIVHKSQGNVHFAPRTKLARDHPKGVACFMQDFISTGHHDMEQRTRTAPPVLPFGLAGHGARIRTLSINEGSQAQLRQLREELRVFLRDNPLSPTMRANVLRRLEELNDILGDI